MLQQQHLVAQFRIEEIRNYAKDHSVSSYQF
jgi:hypothetical protein